MLYVGVWRCATGCVCGVCRVCRSCFCRGVRGGSVCMLGVGVGFRGVCLVVHIFVFLMCARVCGVMPCCRRVFLGIHGFCGFCCVRVWYVWRSFFCGGVVMCCDRGLFLGFGF